MRRLTAIFLLILFLFNLAGYRLLFGYLKKQSDTKITLAIDRQEYDAQDLFTIAVDLNMPYQAERTQFERVDGEIVLDGKVYKFVKRRISDGQLILVCVRDAAKTKLQRAEQQLSGFVQEPATKNGSNKNTATNNLLKLLMTDYDNDRFDAFIHTAYKSYAKRILQNEDVPHLLIVRSFTQPPDYATC